MMKIDINSDLGESFGNYTMGNDAEIMKYITSANIACGLHGGDPVVMEKTIMLALENNVAIGAHPGYPDLVGFGRRKMDLKPTEVRAYVLYQIAALKGMVEAMGGKLQHVKAHGALYNFAVKDYETALAIAQAVYMAGPELILFGPVNSEILRAAEQTGLKTASEFFADRAYTKEGTLVPRSQPGAVIHDAAISNARVLHMIRENKVEEIGGTTIDIEADTVCIHGDNPAAIEMARLLREFLENNDIRLTSLH